MLQANVFATSISSRFHYCCFFYRSTILHRAWYARSGYRIGRAEKRKGNNNNDDCQDENDKPVFIISAKWTKWMAEIMCSFDVCLSVCVSVCVCAAAGHGSYMPIAPKRLKLRTSNLTHMFPGTVRTWSPKKFPKGGVAMVTWLPKFLGVKC